MPSRRELPLKSADYFNSLHHSSQLLWLQETFCASLKCMIIMNPKRFSHNNGNVECQGEIICSMLPVTNQSSRMYARYVPIFYSDRLFWYWWRRINEKITKFILSHIKGVLSFITNKKCPVHEIWMLKSNFKLIVGNFVLCCMSASSKFWKFWPSVRPLKRHTNSWFCHKNRPFIRKVLFLIKCPMGAVCKLRKRINKPA